MAQELTRPGYDAGGLSGAAYNGEPALSVNGGRGVFGETRHDYPSKARKSRHQFQSSTCFSLGWFDALWSGARGAGVLSRSARPSLNAASPEEKTGSSPLQGFARLIVLFIQSAVPSALSTFKGSFVPIAQALDPFVMVHKP